jgi:hypothetical protein
LNHSITHRQKRERTMRKTLTTAALVFALSCHAWAGIMQTPPAPQPTPDSATQDGATLNGEIQNDAPDSLTQTALELLAVLPSIL